MNDRTERRFNWWILFGVFALLTLLGGIAIAATVCKSSWIEATVYITLTSVTGITVVILLGVGLARWIKDLDHTRDVVIRRADQTDFLRERLSLLLQRVDGLEEKEEEKTDQPSASMSPKDEGC